MKSEKLSTEIAALERKIKDAKNAVVKKVLEKKIEGLRSELKKEDDGLSKLAKAKKKIREMSQKDFNEFIKTLSKKDGYAFLKSMTKDEIKRDIQRVAKPVGWRFRGDNTKKPTRRDIREKNDVYYEGRRNRSDVSRAVKLAEGGGISADNYEDVEYDSVYEIHTKEGKDGVPFYVVWDKIDGVENGYFAFKTDAENWIKSQKYAYADGGGVGISVSEFEKRIKDMMKQENKWHFVNEVVDGKPVRMKFYVGKKEVDVQIFTINNLAARMPRNYSGKRDTVGMIMENFGSKMEWGGTAESSETGDFIGGENDSSMYKNGGGVGFIPMDVEEKFALLAKWGGMNIREVVEYFNAMVDAGITDSDLKITPTKNTNLQREKAVEKKIKEIWGKVEPKYKGELKGNRYYSMFKELISRNSIYEGLLGKFKSFRKNQNFADGGSINGNFYILLNDESKKWYSESDVTKIPNIYFADGYQDKNDEGVAFVHYDNALRPLYKANGELAEKMLQYAGMEGREIKADGGGVGSLENNYIQIEDSESLWNTWTLKQKYHFLKDHFRVELSKAKNEDELRKAFYQIEDTARMDYNELPSIVKSEIKDHKRQGQYAKGGSLFDEPHRTEMSGIMANGGMMAKGGYFEGMTFRESVLKKGLSDMLNHLYKAQNELDGIMAYLDRTGQGGMKSALKSKFGLSSFNETTEKIDEYLNK